MSSNSATPPQAASPKSPAAPEPPVAAEIAPPRRKRRAVRWVLLAILVGGVFWVSISGGPVAQEVRELAGFKADRIILDSAFSIGPHTFRYYKFSLPAGSESVAVVGQFKSAAQSPAAGGRIGAASENNAGTKDAGKNNPEAGDNNGIQVYVLTEPAFQVWQKQSATSSLYDSGNVAESTVHADIPAGAGIYYLVFSNKSAPKTSKSVHATVMLRYKSWLRRALTRHNGT
jgi:hypothetical protein